MSTIAKNPARILMIEDNPPDVVLLRYGLNQHDEAYQLEVLRDGEEAIDFIRQQRKNPAAVEPCVILLDLHLPKHDGAAVLQAIREVPAMVHVRIVVLTSLGRAEDERRALDLGARLYRLKPTQLDGWTALALEILAICREHAPAAF